MASAIATAKPDPREAAKALRRRWLPGSRLGRLIIALNLIGLAILIVGALVLNEFRRGLIEARTDSLRTQGELIAKVITIGATQGDPVPAMDSERAGELLAEERRHVT